MGDAGKRRFSSSTSSDGSSITDHRSPITGDTFIETDWGTALDVMAGKFAQEKAAHGGDTFAVLASAKCTNEENYLFAKLARQLMSTNSIDHCARL
jgi:predicted molibdopterin-dependent oxidoreductase YjgC